MSSKLQRYWDGQVRDMIQHRITREYRLKSTLLCRLMSVKGFSSSWLWSIISGKKRKENSSWYFNAGKILSCSSHSNSWAQIYSLCGSRIKKRYLRVVKMISLFLASIFQFLFLHSHYFLTEKMRGGTRRKVRRNCVKKTIPSLWHVSVCFRQNKFSFVSASL